MHPATFGTRGKTGLKLNDDDDMSNFLGLTTSFRINNQFFDVIVKKKVTMTSKNKL